MPPFNSLRSLARALLVLTATFRLTPRGGSPQEHVARSILNVALWTIMTYSFCMTPQNPRYRSLDCGIAAFEVGVVAAVAIPVFHWGDAEWDIIRHYFGGWLPSSQSIRDIEQ
ncbi:hypothetical protein F4818DRAFT_440584 [Hypoxylon cercidicola]|nr:hypothetical protein F4818DRAFT_440584 [Hypoxylon cercidicola]